MKALQQLLKDGMREIATPEGASLLRTVVQWDGDVMTFVTASALDQKDLIEQHFQRVKDCLRTFRGLRWALQTLTGLGTAAPVVALVDALGHPERALQEFAGHAAPYCLGSVLCFMAPKLLRWFLRRA